MVGWFSAVVLSPLEVLRHGFTVEIRYICAFTFGGFVTCSGIITAASRRHRRFLCPHCL